MFNKKEGIMGSGKRIPITPYLLLIPAMVLMIMFSFYPFIKTAVSSFAITTEFGDFIRFNGLGNWKRVLHDEVFVGAFKNTMIFGSIALVVSFFVAMFFALLSTNRGKGSRVYQILFSLPMVIASAPIAAIWRFILRENGGLMNQVLGTEIAWLRDSRTALIVVALVTAWTHIASNYLYLLVGFRNVSDDLIEAAKIDGAGWWTRTLRIMLPMASPQIFYVLFLNIIWSLKVITQIQLLTSGGPDNASTTLMWYLYGASRTGQFEKACCTSLVLFVLIFVATRIQFAFEKKLVHYQ